MIQTHFSLKRKEIEKQCEDWISDMEKDPKGSNSISTGLASLKVCNVRVNLSKLYNYGNLFGFSGILRSAEGRTGTP